MSTERRKVQTKAKRRKHSKCSICGGRATCRIESYLDENNIKLERFRAVKACSNKLCSGRCVVVPKINRPSKNARSVEARGRWKCWCGHWNLNEKPNCFFCEHAKPS